MNRKTSLTFLISMLLLSILFGPKFVNQVKAQAIPTVTITFGNGTNSSAYEYRLRDTFKVNVTVDSPDIAIWSWQVGIYFNNTVLECTSIGNGTFFAGKYTLGFQSGIIYNDLGYVTFSGDSLRLPEAEGVKGSGVLMWFEFSVKGRKHSLLDLTLSPPDLVCGTKLNEKVGSNVVPISPIILYDGDIIIRRIGDLGGELPPEFFKFDDQVDGKDLALFLLCFKGEAPPEVMYLADLGRGVPPKFFEYDGKVDGKDLALLLLCFRGLGPDT